MRTTAGTVVFVCPSRFSMGELHNALQMGRQLKRDLEREVTIIVPASYEGLAAAQGFTEHVFPKRSADNRQWLADLLDHLHPDLLVLADHANVALERASIDYESVYSAGCPTVSIDSLQFTPGPREVEFAIAGVRGAEHLRHWLPRRVQIPPVPEGIPVLTPVPVGSTLRAQNPFALYSEPPRVQIGAARLRDGLGVPRDHRLVVIAQSRWASTVFGHLAQGTGRRGLYEKLRSRRLVRALDATGHRVTLLEITAGDRSAESTENVELRNLSRLNSQEFTDTIAAADLYVTDNLISGAMAQAATLETPVLALTNSHERTADPTDTIDQELDRNFKGWGFPFLVNPFGWHRELATILRDNLYLECVPRVEVFEADRLMGAFEAQLGSDPDRRATAALRESMAALPSFSTVVATLSEFAPADLQPYEMENR